MDKVWYQRFIADDRSYFSLIKKDIHKIANDAGFSQTKLHDIDLVIAELTSNLQKHATGGAEILVNVITKNKESFLEIICIDNGPGISNLNKALEDGFSSGRTMGHGFGSIKRLSDEFDIYSLPDWGTIVLVRIYKIKKLADKEDKLKIGALLVAKPGEQVCGDGYYLQHSKKGFRILVADGLGHGNDAYIAIKEAVHAFKTCSEESAADVIRFIHTSIRKTRGIVGNVFLYNHAEAKWRICGVGNISTRMIGGIQQKNIIPYNGIIGHNIPGTMNDTELSKDDFAHFISCSDGIRSRWDLSKFPMLLKKDPMIIAAAIYKDFARLNDDMSVITCKIL